MKKSFSESPVGKFLLGKGFYAALAVCVLGAGAAAWVIVDKTIDSFTAEPPAASGTTLQNDVSSPAASQKEQQVEQKVSNISKPSSSSSSAPSSSSASEISTGASAASSAASEESAQDAISPNYGVSSFMLPVDNTVFNLFPVRSWSKMKRWTNGTPITALTSRRSWGLLCGRWPMALSPR